MQILLSVTKNMAAGEKRTQRKKKKKKTKDRYPPSPTLRTVLEKEREKNGT